MELVGNPLVLAAVGAVVVLAIVLAVLHFRFRIFRRRKGRGRKSAILSQNSRIEILESKVIDGERKLLLVRCDQVEHLIVVGGPADVVVENDVRKVRGPAPAPARSASAEPGKRSAASTWQPSAGLLEAGAAAPAKAAEPRPTPRTGTESRPPRTSGVQPPLGHSAATPRVDTAHQNPPAPQRSQPADPHFGRRETASPRRAPQTQSTPAQTGRAAEPHRAQPAAAADRQARTAGRTVAPAGGLPAAQIPWSDPDSIENEIVRALRFDPHTRPSAAGANGRRELSTAKSMVDSSTTLGDLADRLEEALAREVQAANPPRRQEVDIQEFGFDLDSERKSDEPATPAPREREERRERAEPPKPAKAAMAAAPEPEARREAPAQPERREETPVISLNSRRREAADPLEDEMARLLGELTSDTKGR